MHSRAKKGPKTTRDRASKPARSIPKPTIDDRCAPSTPPEQPIDDRWAPSTPPNLPKKSFRVRRAARITLSKYRDVDGDVRVREKFMVHTDVRPPPRKYDKSAKEIARNKARDAKYLYDDIYVEGDTETSEFHENCRYWEQLAADHDRALHGENLVRKKRQAEQTRALSDYRMHLSDMIAENRHREEAEYRTSLANTSAAHAREMRSLALHYEGDMRRVAANPDCCIGSSLAAMTRAHEAEVSRRRWEHVNELRYIHAAYTEC